MYANKSSRMHCFFCDQKKTVECRNVMICPNPLFLDYNAIGYYMYMYMYMYMTGYL